MKVVLATALGLALVVVSVQAHSAAKVQQDVNAFLTKTTSPLRKHLLDPLIEDFDPTADSSMYNDEGKAALKLVQDVNDKRTLKQKNFFSLFNSRHREEALMLFEIFINCKNWDPCFRNNANYFRQRMNEGVFIYALYVGIIHHPLIAKGIVLPALYEITPHMFTNSEVITQAYTAKMKQRPGKFTMDYTGSPKNPEQHVAYFGEDIGMNVHHVSWHMDFPFWWEDRFGYSFDRKGELFYWMHHQLTARFDAERLSNNMNFVEELYWDRPIYEGFAPHTTYKYGGEFPARPDNINFEDVEGVARIRDLMIWEDRFRDAIAHGYVTASDGTLIDILNDRGIDILGDIIESSTYSINPYYYGSIHNTAHIVLGRQGDPKGKFNQPPGVMEHFETATRDPSFFRLHKYMNNLLKEYKDRLTPYTKEDLLWEGIELAKISIEGSLETYFEDFEFSIANAVDDAENVEDIALTAVVKRLNHKPFSFKMVINNNKGAPAIASARIYMCPRRDANGIPYHPNEGRWGCIEMDKFYIELAAGENNILRESSMSTVTIPDIPSFETIKEKTNAAVASGSDSTGLDDFERNCGIPDRLMLPKGKENGLQMILMAFLEDGEADAAEGFTVDANNEYGGTHAQCGIHGPKYPDKRSMGFPLDRQFIYPRLIASIPNFKIGIVYIYHKPDRYQADRYQPGGEPRRFGGRPPPPGGFGAVRDADDETKQLLLGVKPDVEKILGRSLDEFEVVSYLSQVVSGRNYVAKVRIGEGEYIHIRVYQHWSGTLDLHGVQEDKAVDDPVKPFDPPRGFGGRTGGVGAVRDADAETQQLLMGVKPDVEERLGRTLDEFQVVVYSSQTVAGKNYFAKIRIGEEEYIHIRVFKPLSGLLILHGIQEDKALSDRIEPFDIN